MRRARTPIRRLTRCGAYSFPSWVSISSISASCDAKIISARSTAAVYSPLGRRRAGRLDGALMVLDHHLLPHLLERLTLG